MHVIFIFHVIYLTEKTSGKKTQVPYKEIKEGKYNILNLPDGLRFRYMYI